MIIGIDTSGDIIIFNSNNLHHISYIKDRKWELVLDDKTRVIVSNENVDAIIDALRITGEITYIS